MHYFKINNQQIIRSNSFTPKREDLYAAEITTCTGKTIADRIGWKYSDLTLNWDILPESQLEILLNMTGACTFEFEDSDGIHTEQIIRSSAVNTATRYTDDNGNPIWTDVQIEVKFIDAHN